MYLLIYLLAWVFPLQLYKKKLLQEVPYPTVHPHCEVSWELEFMRTGVLLLFLSTLVRGIPLSPLFCSLIWHASISILSFIEEQDNLQPFILSLFFPSIPFSCFCSSPPFSCSFSLSHHLISLYLSSCQIKLT